MNPSRRYGQHLLCCLILVLSYLPIAIKHYTHFPPPGYDFYQLPAYVSYLRKNFGFSVGMWKYYVFAGVQLSRDYPHLHIYLALPFALLFGDVAGTQIYLLLAYYLLAVFSYLLFFKLSKSKIIAFTLSNALLWSRNVYMTHGTPVFAATQMFLPLSLLFLAKYFSGRDNRFLYLSSAVCGLAILGHLAAGALYVFFPSLIALLFWTEKKVGVFGRERLKALFMYALVSATMSITAFAVIGYRPDLWWRATRISSAQLAPAHAEGVHTRHFLFTTNPFLYLILGVAVVYLIVKRNPSRVVSRSRPFILSLFPFFVFQLLRFLGTDFQFIDAHRSSWFFPVILGGIVSVWLKGLPSYLGRHVAHLPTKLTKLGLLLPLLIGLMISQPLIMGPSIGMCSGNGAYPYIIHEVLAKGRVDLIKPEIIPEWMDTSILDYRVYNYNPYVSIWWNMPFQIPEIHGFFGSLGPTRQYWKNWLDSCITGKLLIWGAYKDTICENQAGFLIDWFSIKYMLGNNASYLSGYYKRAPEEKHGINFIEIKEGFTSPIIKATNTPAVLIISNHDGYNNLLRDLFASVNLNSQHYILVRGPEYIDDLSSAELANFDIAYLYIYKYHTFDKAFEILDDYVANGGRLIIDTGIECPESNSTHLPGFFPISETVRAPLGEEWGFTVSDSPVVQDVVQGVNFSAFDLPIFEGWPWTVSYAPSDSNVKEGAEVVLRSHGYPVIVVGNYEEGKVVWSGMNLPYHMSVYKNLEEAFLHRNLMDWAVQSLRNQDIDSSVKRPRSEEVIIEGYGFNGILFKENAFDGWTAYVTSNGATHKLKIYHAGPDFMYVRVPSDVETPFTVKFRYIGPLIDWFFATLTFATLFVVLDYSLLRGRLIINRGLQPIARKLRKWLKQLVDRIHKWWYKD